jgi:hypothetical protein
VQISKLRELAQRVTDPAMLRTAFYAMKRDAAPGVDGIAARGRPT